MNGIIVVNGYKLLPQVAHMVERIQEEFTAFGVETSVRKTTEVLALLNENCGVVSNLGGASFAIYLDKDRYISNMLEQAGYRLFNSSKAIEICDDKMLTYLKLQGYNIKIPKTISGPLNYSGLDAEDFKTKVIKELSLPLVAKINFGSMGNGVCLIQTKAELDEYEKQFGSRPRLFQKYISSSKGVDYRLITIGGKFVAGMQRKNLFEDFRSNMAQGGIGIKCKIEKPYIQMAERVSQILNLDCAGIDILVGPMGEPIFCEANSNAFISGIEKTTGVNVAKTYAEYIIKQVG